MNVLFVTIPLRDGSDYFRPLGPLSIMKYMRDQGFEGVDLYDIDFFRPSFEEVVEEIVRRKPAILGISAVVSTSYKYTKDLSVEIKKALPDCLIVMGGNMGASADIILRRTEVDIVVLDDGEFPFLEICERAKKTRVPSEFGDIKGLVYLNKKGELKNTGYGETISLEKMWAIDDEDVIKAHGTLDYMIKIAERGGFKNIWYRDLENIPEDTRVATFDVSKGCVARCTFCHRWTKGLRHIPVPELEKRLNHLVTNHNVKFMDINAESFGNDKRWLEGFLELMKKYNIVWRANGVRANTFDQEWMKRCKDAGAVYLGFGNETGSETMLKIMEKKVKLQDNYNAMEWAIKTGLKTSVALVLGMPGESTETIKETIEYTKFCVTLTPEFDPNNISINYAQALPGTPLYEFGRSRGLIGKDIDGEEDYLLSISDRNAHDETTTINFTDYPTLIHRTWRPLITIETNYHYVKTFGLEHYRSILPNNHALMYDELKTKGPIASNMLLKKYKPSGYFANPKRLIEQGVGDEGEKKGLRIKPPSLINYIIKGRHGAAMVWYPVLFYQMRHFLPLLIFIKTIRFEGWKTAINLAIEYFDFYIKKLFVKKSFNYEFKSLRKIVDQDIGPLEGDNPEMAPLRRGR